MKNPLLKVSSSPFGTIPFHDIRFEHFLPAISSGIKSSEVALQEITECPDNPTFKNTILALELSGQILDMATRTYYHLFGSESDQNFKDLSDKINPMLAECDNNLYLNEKLFKRIEEVFSIKHLFTILLLLLLDYIIIFKWNTAFLLSFLLSLGGKRMLAPQF